MKLRGFLQEKRKLRKKKNAPTARDLLAKDFLQISVCSMLLLDKNELIDQIHNIYIMCVIIRDLPSAN